MIRLKPRHILSSFLHGKQVSRNFIFLIKDSGGFVTYANSLFYSISGINPDVFKKAKFDELFQPAAEVPDPQLSSFSINNIVRLKIKEKDLWFYTEEFTVKYFFKKYTLILGYNASSFFKLEADKKIRENQENLQSFFNTLDDLVFILDVDGNIISINDTTIKRLGYAEEELRGMHVLSVHPEPRREEAGRIVGEMLEGKAKFCPVPLITKSGEIIPVETRVIRGKWSGKDVLIGTSKDISVLRASEEKFSKIFNINPTAMTLSIIDGMFVDVNEAFLKLTGFSREEVIGKTIDNLSVFTDIRKREEAIAILKSDGVLKNFETTIKSKKGELRESLFEGHFVNLQDRQLLLTVMTDITELKRLHSETQEYKKRFDIFFENLNDVIFIHDISKHRFIYINKAAENVLEKPVSELKGVNDLLLSISHSEDKESIKKALEEVIKSGYFALEYKLEFPGGRIKWIWLKMWTSKDEQNNYRYLEGIASDITGIKLAQDSIERSLKKEKELVEMKSLFVSTTSHEFRTPLAGILSSIEILESYGDKWAQVKKTRHYSKIKNSVSHMTKMLDDVLFLNRAEVGLLVYKPEEFDLIALSKEIIDNIKSTDTWKSAIIQFKSDTQRPGYFLDQKLITLVLSNLLTNAVKYSEERSPVEFTIKQIDGELEIIINDQGIGISEHDLDHIFDPFFRASNVGSASGSGLGLTIVKKAIELHGGEIAIKSKLGKGTRVIITIPVKEIV